MRELTDPVSQAVIEAPTRTAAFSKTTLAHARLTKRHLDATKESMIRDMTTQDLSDGEILQQFRQVAAVSVRLADLTTSIEASSAPDAPFTEKEVQDMRAIKKDHDLTEQSLAELYDTNQSKINRVLNNQTR
jgi:hypothetical protein